MTVRWIDPSSDATEIERELIGMARDDVPEGMQDRVWGAVLGALPPIVGPGGGSDGGGSTGGGDLGSMGAGSGTGVSGAAAGAAATGGVGTGSTTVTVSALAVAKAFAVGVASGVTVLTGYSLVSSRPERSRAPTIQAVVSSSPSTSERPPSVARDVPAGVPTSAAVGVEPSSARLPDVDDESAAESPRAPPTAAFDDVPPERPSADRTSVLHEEARLVSEARIALRRGDVGGALMLLEAARTRFPGGVLAQEREVLAVEALARGGQEEAARERAASFLRLHPSSPHAARMRELAGERAR